MALNVPDNTSKTITVRLSLNCGIGGANTDGDDFGFSLSNANFTTASSSTSSQKTAFSAAASASYNYPLFFVLLPSSSSYFSPSYLYSPHSLCFPAGPMMDIDPLDGVIKLQNHTAGDGGREILSVFF